MALVSFKIEHRIDDMFQQSRSGDRSIFGDMPNDEDRHAAALRVPHQLACHFLHLADAARRRRDLFRVHRLDRVDNHCGRLDLLRRFEDLFEGGFRQN